MEFAGLAGGGLHQRDEDSRAETRVERYAISIQLVDELDEVGIGLDGRRSGHESIAHHGEFTELGVEKVRSNVTNFPLRSDGLAVPIGRIERPKEGEEFIGDLREEVGGEDGREHEKFIAEKLMAISCL